MNQKQIKQAWERTRAAIASGEDPLSFVGSPSGIPGGYCLLAIAQSLPYPVGRIDYRWHTRHCWEILMIHTLDNVRKAGVAKRMIAELKRWCAANGVTELFTEEVMPCSQSLIEGAGFKNRRDGWRLKLPRR